MASQERIMLMIHASPTQVSTGKGMTALTGSVVQHGVSGSTCSALQDVHTPQSAAHVPEALPAHKAGRTANMHACCFLQMPLSNRQLCCRTLQNPAGQHGQGGHRPGCVGSNMPGQQHTSRGAHSRRCEQSPAAQ